MNSTPSIAIDTIIDKALSYCHELPPSTEYQNLTRNIRELRDRLAGGKLHIAVLGQFNRGKSSFINALLGMKVLPVSVLPITSVPTVIAYGKENACTIAFSDGQEPQSTSGSTEAVHELLDRYATEKNNPRNREHVSEITVQCQSELLHHGTVIIDTPGFGSTYIHNTQTTLDYLSTCDAALFLLSADLPITQVELDFLQSVVKTVPRIFFIYNKIDLINKEERATSELFIKDTLRKTFGISLDVHLFSVTAKKLGNGYGDESLYEKHGFARVEKEILDFLIREKYFALSEALTGKFSLALSTILQILHDRRQELIKPIEESRNRLSTVKKLLASLTEEQERALSLAEVEAKALIDFLRKLVHSKRESLRSRFKDLLTKLCPEKPKKSHEPIITSTLAQLFEESVNLIYLSTLTELNKPLRKATNAHNRELATLIEHTNLKNEELVDSEYQPCKISLSVEELDTTKPWERPMSSYAVAPFKSTMLSRLASQEKQRQQIINYYTTQIINIIDTSLEELIETIGSDASALFSEFTKELKSAYEALAKTTREIEINEQAILKREEDAANPDLLKVESLIDGFESVKESVL